MEMITQAKLDELNGLTSDKLEVKATASQITMRLAAIVAISNFKILAGAGRTGNGGTFNATTKTLTLPLIPMREFIPGKMTLDGEQVDIYRVRGMILEIDTDTMTDAIAGSPHDLDKLITLARRLGGKNAKSYASIADAAKARNERKAKQQAEQEAGPSAMDMPMWDPARGEWYDGEYETRTGGQMRLSEPRPDMGSYGHHD